MDLLPTSRQLGFIIEKTFFILLNYNIYRVNTLLHFCVASSTPKNKKTKKKIIQKKKKEKIWENGFIQDIV